MYVISVNSAIMAYILCLKIFVISLFVIIGGIFEDLYWDWSFFCRGDLLLLWQQLEGAGSLGLSQWLCPHPYTLLGLPWEFQFMVESQTSLPYLQCGQKFSVLAALLLPVFALWYISLNLSFSFSIFSSPIIFSSCETGNVSSNVY